MARFAVGPLEGPALAAAARFHAGILPQLRAGDAETLTLVFPAADHTHHAWRLAIVQALAREQAPRRVNAVAGDDPEAIERACEWLESAPGVTGQYLPLADAADSHGAGAVV